MEFKTQSIDIYCLGVMFLLCSKKEGNMPRDQLLLNVLKENAEHAQRVYEETKRLLSKDHSPVEQQKSQSSS